MDPHPAEDRARVHRDPGTGEGRGPAHGVPGGRLPQHLRVLGGPRGHLPHRRRAVHAPLRLLPDRHRQARARSTATSRAGSPSPCARWGCATPPSPASPATTCPTRAPGCTPRRSARSTSSTPAPASRCSSPTSPATRPCSARCSTPRPEVLAHNVETVPRIFKRIRPAFRYERSLDVITQARAAGLVTKSNLILGMGEEIDEVHQALPTCTTPAATSSRSPSTCAPRPRHHPVERWVRPEEFVELADDATGHRLRRRHDRPAGALVLPRRPALRAGDRGPRGLARLTATITRGQSGRARASPSASPDPLI